ncbi:hypothetical protein FXV83_20960 [Bradyrhizobium hipponense]|uniref:Uncharacterized protein n=1 Tax=Bradyrhizobium hipponense TaxID=2605638 RepID=A0A5S4YJM9_9BRAD|nr:hypothetical protein [Bradyrhizobium hipponense]TYO64600.1 hypothetical protein FXV83_20960 [Bradyrhizobium hipponense]
MALHFPLRLKDSGSKTFQFEKLRREHFEMLAKDNNIMHRSITIHLDILTQAEEKTADHYSAPRDIDPPQCNSVLRSTSIIAR